ncbi:recombinase family protein [Mixta mediterraneensis]|uniref:recombinase family protein n=1 Tax=Mixta mediterraneensis TaxID=2758443 RepID=UPI001873F7D2|nr:recombinase family protein [Mixta mediterraneensis]MBE5254395.1 recombinase family protein [Mixta mediterraneensis]
MARYARVSTGEQDLSLQLDALQQAGCDTAAIFVDKSSGAKTEPAGIPSCRTTSLIDKLYGGQY